MNLRNLVLTVALVSAACTLPNTTSQLPCKTVGATTAECPTGQTCGSDKLCREIVLTCPDPLTQRQCGGNCVDITKDPFNCGGCGTTCAAGEQCILDSQNNPKCKTYCAPNQTACAQSAGGFICENLSNDRTNCGTCGNTCITGQVCTPPAGNPNGAGTCQIQCSGGLTNCSGNCYDTNIENLACGACNNACTPGTHCSAGKCVIVCTPGQTECPAGSGNCVDLTKDRTNCGGCGVACAAGQICTSSACQISCQSGLTLCGSSCVNTVADANNCGGCGLSCGAGQVCTNHGPGNTGLCELHCPTGETACGYPAWTASTAYFPGNQVANGGNLYLCTTGGTSAASGGPAGTATTSVTDGSAAWKFVSTAPTGASQCVSLQSDRNNCGTCDDVTNSKACGNGQVCLSGACVVSCAPGLTQCNGTCVDTHNDPTNCGGCGTSCAAGGSTGPVCGNGLCGVSCPAGETNCGGKCVDTSSDPGNCGACTTASSGAGNHACLQGQACVTGGCQITCPSGSVICNNKCVDAVNDNNNCNAAVAGCGHPCAAGQVCSGGACSTTCSSPPLSMCGSGASAFCSNTSYDPSNCGVCGKICKPTGSPATVPGYPNASAFCASGNCGATCTGTFADCNGSLDDGCETDLTTSAAHCGTCTNSCPAADNAPAKCISGSCNTTSCLTPTIFADCDGDPANGCEADKAHDAANCGSCGTACSGTSLYCTSGCVPFANLSGVQENLSIAAAEALTEWGAPCFSESYSHAGTTLAAIQAACSGGTQVLVACAAPGASTLLVAAAGAQGSVFPSGGTGLGATFYVPGASVTAFGFAPTGAATVFSIASTPYPYDVGGTITDGFAAGVGSQRLSWPAQGGALTAGGRCGDRVGSSATSNYQRLVFTK